MQKARNTFRCLCCGTRLPEDSASVKFCNKTCRKRFKNRTSKIRKSRRKAVLERDNYKCRKCGAIYTLTVHHIIPLHKGGGWELDNLITLCKPCHDEAHGIVRRKDGVSYRLSPYQRRRIPSERDLSPK